MRGMTNTEGGADKIAKAIDGAYSSLIERRNIKAAGEVCSVVLDVVEAMLYPRVVESKSLR